jgi:type I restriction enzyme S subunit
VKSQSSPEDFKSIGPVWLGPIPCSWDVVSLKYLARIYAGGTPDRENRSYWDDGTIPWLNSGEVNQWIIKEPSAFITEEGFRNSSAKWIPKSGLVMALAGQGKTKGMVAQLAIEATCNQSMAAIIANATIHPRFLVWWLHANYETIRNLAGGELRDGLNLEIVGNIPVPKPPLERQAVIEGFLDRETSRIDGLIAAKERVLVLLAEKRIGLITRAVTRGLDKQTPLRDSGVPWLGEIPAHWHVERARWLFKERDERSETGEEEMLTVSHITGVTPRSEKNVNMFEAESTEGYKICFADDLVINTLWAWMGAMGVSPVKGIVSPAYNVYRPGRRLEPGFVDAIVRVPIFAQEVTRYSKGVWSSRLRLYPEGFFETFFPVPPLIEQRAIVDHIANETKKLLAIRTATERTIELLRERRVALVNAAVTEQIDMVSES